MRRAAEHKRENVCLGKNSTDYVIKVSEFLSPDFIISIILAFCKYITECYTIQTSIGINRILQVRYGRSLLDNAAVSLLMQEKSLNYLWSLKKRDLKG